tara:strand:+ start:147 stop:326 length:180 start_codon:yes stop_codon:yes gene_type:complete
MADRRPLINDGGQVKELPATDKVAGHVTSANINDIVVLNQAAYDALSPPDANTLYIIEE